MAENSQNLQTLFATAKQEKQSLESSLETNTDSYRSQVNETIAKFEECQRLIGQLSLFSPNESLEDIATGDLQYLTVDYLLADLLQRSHNANRETVLRRSLEEYEKYLTRLDDYGLLSPADKKLYERYLENPSSFTLASMNDPAARREVKVARFREEKDLKQKLEYLSQNQGLLQNEDDIPRQLYLAEINLYTHQTFQSLDLLSQELSMLSKMRDMPQPPESLHSSDPRRQRDADKTGYSERLDPPLAQLLKNGRAGPLLSKDGKPLQPFVLTDRRTQLQKGVFRPGHNLPTMTIEEYLEEEKRRGGIVEGGNQPTTEKEADEDDMDKADEETMKARAWDEFKEENPRGSGNTLNRG
ncbi:hypothetical protein VTN00DRAFT_9833 [Thermoascus crustaceus]|uniref:uncharacterized protein n=1 Tax=Thermoascus crustaceus TaxID=5088 RepID=UPI0037449610